SCETAAELTATTHRTTTHRQRPERRRPSGKTSGIPTRTIRTGTRNPTPLTRPAAATTVTCTLPESIATTSSALRLIVVARVTPEPSRSGPTTLPGTREHSRAPTSRKASRVARSIRPGRSMSPDDATAFVARKMTIVVTARTHGQRGPRGKVECMEKASPPIVRATLRDGTGARIVTAMPRRDATPTLEIRLFGPPEARVNGAPLEVDTRKALAVLAVLATDGRAYARDELAALLWPESDDAGPRGALRRTLSVMRAAIDESVLRIDRQRVELDRARCWIDLAEVQRLAATDSTDALGTAADLVGGPFLAGFSLRDSPEFDDWRAARATQVERTVTDVLDRLVAALAATGETAKAAAVAGRRIDLDPLDEAAHVSRMELLAASGDRSGALRQYRACVAILERELGVAPLPETTARYEAIRDAPAAAAPRLPTPTPAPLQ